MLKLLKKLQGDGQWVGLHPPQGNWALEDF